MDVAYFNLTDMAERVKYLLILQTTATEDFKKNQIRSISSTLTQRTRLLFTYQLHVGLVLTVSNPVFYPNPSPRPIAKSDPSEVHPRFFLQLSIRCTQECYVWCFCSSTPSDLTETQIQNMGVKSIVLGDIDTPITYPLAEQSYGTVYVYLVAQNGMGVMAVTQASVTFILSNHGVIVNEPSSSLEILTNTTLPNLGTPFLFF